MSKASSDLLPLSSALERLLEEGDVLGMSADEFPLMGEAFELYAEVAKDIKAKDKARRQVQI
jgi:hypothetical protein